ncbi:MAG: TRAP transporter small permease, partial [Desulfovibrio sp.]|nr:TRAP transporter small permease [Desulfovibrio sp.]
MESTTAATPSQTPQQGQTGLLGWLDENFEKIFLVTGILAIILFITLQTAYRYIITSVASSAGAMVWTEELSRYVFIWITYLALCTAIRKRSSIRVDILYDMMPARWQNISWILVHLCFLLLTVVIAVTGWSQIDRLLTFPQYTPAMRIPFLLPYLRLPIGFGLMSLRLVQDLWRQSKVCGTKDTIIGILLTILLWAPLYPVLLALNVPSLPVLYDYIPPLPVL